MTAIRAFWARLTGMFTGARRDDDLRAELASHVEMATEENIRRGMTPEAARRAALLESGGLTQAAEAVRDQRGLPPLESLLSDLRYALRALRRAPVFTLVVVATLALGIGANTAIFSVIRGVLLRPLPHREGDRLVYVRQSTDAASRPFSVPEVRELRTGAPSFSGGIAEYSSWNVVLQGESDAVRINTALVTGNYFEVMGLSPILGRLTRPSDDGPGVPPVMVLTNEFWLRRFGGDSSVIGRQVRVDGSAATIIGVVQPAPFFPGRFDVVMNMVISPHHLGASMTEVRDHRMTQLVARLAPGASLSTARAEVATTFEQMKTANPQFYLAASHPRVDVIPFKTAIGERAQLTMWLLMGAAAFVMIIAAANVANLTLMRGMRREHEFIVRASLGAGVARLRRLLLIENLTLSFAGAGLGAALASAGVPLLAALASRFSPRSGEIGIDATVFVFTLALAIGIALFFSLVAPIPGEGTLAAASTGGRRVAGSLRKQRLQRSLVVVQVAASVVLLAGAGLMTRTMMHLADVSTGLRTEEVLSLQISLLNPSQLMTRPELDGEAKERYYRLRDEIAAYPGVVAAGIGSTAPLRRSMEVQVLVEGRAPSPNEPLPSPDMRAASPEYFGAAGIPLKKGRLFESTDQRGGGRVVILNEALARELFPGEDPIGRRIGLTGLVTRFGPFSKDWRTVVGVVGDTQDGGLDAKIKPTFWMPFDQEVALSGVIVIRADSNVARLATAATQAARRIAPGVPIENVLTVAQVKEQSVAPRRLNAILFSSFGLLALVIATVGIAGVLAFSVSTRTNEIGIRMSLGARRSQVEGMFIREGGILVAAGLVLGMVGSWFAAGVLRGLLFGVEPHDPVTLVGVAALMAAIGILACWIPALRAARVDPVVTLRAN